MTNFSESMAIDMDGAIDLPKRSLFSGNTPQTWPIRLIERLITRSLDVSLSLLVCLFLLPGFALIAALIFLQDGSPFIFSQPRVGRSGKAFQCLKFRTMRLNSDHLLETYLRQHPTEAVNWHRYKKLKDDPRVTPIGRFLRKASLDEFPQLINVLKGEMSLVGPRPIMMDEVETYGQSLRFYQQVKPGITGLWQVMGRNRLSFRRRIAIDRVYVGKRSIWLYLDILMRTLPAVIFQRGSR